MTRTRPPAPRLRASSNAARRSRGARLSWSAEYRDLVRLAADAERTGDWAAAARYRAQMQYVRRQAAYGGQSLPDREVAKHD